MSITSPSIAPKSVRTVADLVQPDRKWIARKRKPAVRMCAASPGVLLRIRELVEIDNDSPGRRARLAKSYLGHITHPTRVGHHSLSCHRDPEAPPDMRTAGGQHRAVLRVGVGAPIAPRHHGPHERKAREQRAKRARRDQGGRSLSRSEGQTDQ